MRYLLRANTDNRHWLAKHLTELEEMEDFASSVLSLCPESKVVILDLKEGEVVTYYPRSHTEKGPHTGARSVTFA